MASGVSSGKMCAQEMVFEPVFSGLVTSVPSTSTMPAVGERGAQLAPLRCWSADEQRDGLGDAGELLGRRQAVGALRGDARRAPGAAGRRRAP